MLVENISLMCFCLKFIDHFQLNITPEQLNMTAIQLSLIKLGDDKSKFKFRMYSNARAPELLLFIIRCLGRRDRDGMISKNSQKVEAFKFIGKVQYPFVRRFHLNLTMDVER